MTAHKKRILVLTESEYLQRLQVLLTTTTLKSNRLIVTGDSIGEATLLAQELADQILQNLEAIADTDFAIELKEAMVDIWVLIKFLDISLDVIME